MVAVAKAIGWSISFCVSIAKDKMFPSQPEVNAIPVASECSRTYWWKSARR